jgi:hypothetical protein
VGMTPTGRITSLIVMHTLRAGRYYFILNSSLNGESLKTKKFVKEMQR